MHWQCLACGKTRNSPRKPRWCDCGTEDPYFEVDDAPTGEAPRIRATLAADVSGDLPQGMSTGDAELDELLSGGIVPGSSVLVHGPRGSGKSRLVARWASRVPCLYAHAELTAKVTRAILSSTGADPRAVWLYQQIAGWEREADRLGVRVAILDSISEGRHPGRVLRMAREWAQRGAGDRIAWCVSHVNTHGRAKGGTDSEHACDYEIEITPAAKASGCARVRLLKSRLGPTGTVLVPLVPGAVRTERRRRARQT